MKTLSIIIPAFNEEENIKIVLDEVITIVIPGWEKEIIVIDDGSTDETGKLALSYMSKVRYIKHPINKGKGEAIKTGIVSSSGDCILIQDADREYNSKHIPELVRAFETTHSAAIYGSRNLRPGRRGYPLYIFGVVLLTALVNLRYKTILTDVYTGYKLFKGEVIRDITLESSGFEFEMEITMKILKAGGSIYEIPINYEPRKFKDGKKIRGWDGAVGLWTWFRNSI
ncbi:MAG TPA: glycosyltransferase family 2 protein [Candidatus Paceibacterota bacterium]